MAIQAAQAFLIHPGKNDPAPVPISANELTLGSNKLSDMLAEIFNSDPTNRDFEVTFNPDAAGKQNNECRNLIIAYQKSPTIASGMPIAERLQKCTDNRSGIGLLFLLRGSKGLKSRVVVSRFPTDQAVLAEVSSSGLAVEFLEQVFIKKLSSYKALLLDHPTPPSGFWSGSATDRQANGSGENISEYWLKDFLDADFSETPAEGTRRLASALKKAIRQNPNLDVKSEIAAASTLAPTTFLNKTTSIDDFCQHFGFSTSTTQSIKEQLPKSSLFGKQFKFDPAEFKKNTPYRTVELNTGAILTARSDNFDSIFKKSTSKSGDVEYTTTGRVTDQRLSRQ